MPRNLIVLGSGQRALPGLPAVHVSHHLQCLGEVYLSLPDSLPLRLHLFILFLLVFKDDSLTHLKGRAGCRVVMDDLCDVASYRQDAHEKPDHYLALVHHISPTRPNANP